MLLCVCRSGWVFAWNSDELGLVTASGSKMVSFADMAVPVTFWPHFNTMDGGAYNVTSIYPMTAVWQLLYLHLLQLLLRSLWLSSLSNARLWCSDDSQRAASFLCEERSSGRGFRKHCFKSEWIRGRTFPEAAKQQPLTLVHNLMGCPWNWGGFYMFR